MGSPIPTMLKAALPAVPGLNLLPGIAKKGGDLPDLTLTHEDVAIDLDNLAAYQELCGFAPRSTCRSTTRTRWRSRCTWGS